MYVVYTRIMWATHTHTLFTQQTNRGNWFCRNFSSNDDENRRAFIQCVCVSECVCADKQHNVDVTHTHTLVAREQRVFDITDADCVCLRVCVCV